MMCPLHRVRMSLLGSLTGRSRQELKLAQRVSKRLCVSYASADLYPAAACDHIWFTQCALPPHSQPYNECRKDDVCIGCGFLENHGSMTRQMLWNLVNLIDSSGKCSRAILVLACSW